MVNIVIDGKELTVEPGTMIIEAADNAGINIPRFCYHKKLSIAANCRMCLVEVEKSRKPMPACATPITDGMKIFTKSKAALESQRSVMEFLLINHPLDCPVCDQGGECELQDVSMDYGSDVSVYTEGKRAVENHDIGSLVFTEMTRCIHCTRCVRFGQEIAGVAELGAVGRGEHMEITTYVQHSLKSELSGNIIDLCPVGALTSKPFRFKARAWEMQQYPSISPHDILGTNIYLNTYNNKVLRVLPRENEAINEVWITDRDRFSYEALNVEHRAKSPMIKVNGEWQEVSWDEALNYSLSQLQKIVAKYGAEQIGALISSSSTMEEMYLLQKLVRGFGCNNIDHRLLEVDFSDQEYLARMPLMGMTIADVESLESVLLVGSNLRKEQPLLAHRLNKAYKENQTEIFALNPVDFNFIFELADKKIGDGEELLYELSAIAKAAIDDNNPQDELNKLLSDVEVSDYSRNCYQSLKEKAAAVIWLGAYAQQHPQASLLRTLVRFIAEVTDSAWGILAQGGNAAGAWLAGAIPHRTPGGSVLTNVGYSAATMLHKKLKSYFLVGLEPELDANDSAQAKKAMEEAEFILSATSFITPQIKEHAHVIFPIAAFSETAGTYINAQADWQMVQGAVKPPGQARPLWRILRVFGTLLELKAFNYQNIEEVTKEIKTLVEQIPEQDPMLLFINSNWGKPRKQNSSYTLLKNKGLYAVDMLVRQAEALQKTPEVLIQRYAFISPKTASKVAVSTGEVIKIIQGELFIEMEVVVDEQIANNCISVPGGVVETMLTGACYAAVTLAKL